MYMKRSIFFIFPFVCTLSAGMIPAGNAYAQKLPVTQAAKAAAAKAALRQVPQRMLPAAASHAATSRLPALVNQTLQTAARAARQRAGQDIRLSVAKLQSALLANLPESQQPSATAFVFTVQHNGQQEVWGATAGHIAKGMGKNLNLIFYNGEQPFVVPAEVVQYGPNLVSDIALLKITQPLPPEITPLELESRPVKLGEALISAGYCKHKLVYTGKQFLQKDNQRFLRTEFNVPFNQRIGLCGSPLLNSHGKAAGVLCGNIWDENTAYASNIGLLHYLLKAAHEGSAEIPLVAGSVTLGEIQTTEHIHSVEAIDGYGRTITRYDTENRLTQSTIKQLLQQPHTRFLRILLEDRGKNPMEFDINHPFRYLLYDVQTNTSYFQPVRW